MEHMIDAVVFAGLLVGGQIPGILHHHDDLMVPLGVRANGAELLIRHGKAFFTITDIFLGIDDGIRQCLYLLQRHIYDVECQPLGRLAADAGQT